MKKGTFEKLCPAPYEVKLNDGKTYSLKRLTNKGLFRLSFIASKMGGIINWNDVLAKVDQEDSGANLSIATNLIIGIPLCESDFNLLIQSLLVDQANFHPSIIDVEEITSDDLMTLLETFVENEDIGGILRRFFDLGARALQTEEKKKVKMVG